MPFPLTTDRLVLREFVDTDWLAVHTYAADPEVVRFLEWGPNTEAETREFVRRALAWQREEPRATYESAITLRDGGELIGGAGLRLAHRDDGEAELGYCLHRSHWRKGYATEAVDMLCATAFGFFGVHRVAATCDPANLPSVRVLERAGFTCEGLLREHRRVKGDWRSSLVFGLLFQDWRARFRPGAPGGPESR